MALHGQIQVNGQTVGGWSARRTEPLDGRDGSYVYECEVNGRLPFTVLHRYEDGAVALAAKVLSLAGGEN